MKKWQKILLLILVCYISYFIVFGILNLTTLNKKNISIISFIFLVLPAVFYFLVIKNIIKKENKEVTQVSLKIQKLIELNNNYDFKKISKRKHSIIEREYSRKSLDRVTASSIIKYHIENNIDFIRTDIENALYNISLLEEYINDVNEIFNYESNNKSKYPLKNFKKLKNVFLIV